MNRLLITIYCIVLIICFALISAPVQGSASLPAAQKILDKVELSDKTGDVQKGGVDIKKLSFTSDGLNLIVVVEVEGDLTQIYKQRPAGEVLTLNLDTDQKNTTGGILFNGSMGFEYEVKVNVCLVYENTPGHETVACSGGFKGAEPKRLRSGVDISKFDGAGKYSTKETGSSLELPKGAVTATRIEALVPYKQISCSPAQAIRILAKEHDEAGSKVGYFPEAQLRLK